MSGAANNRRYDIAIAGGGLAGGLIALALHRAQPALRFVLVEAGEALGGNHRWSWFSSDLGPEETMLLADFRKQEWAGGYTVRFPAYTRKLRSPYNSLSSADFDAALRRELPEEAILTKSDIASLDADGVTLANGTRLDARAVIDCRGAAPTRHLQGGWQVFMGRHLRTSKPHGVECPVIMDADIEQHSAYRFVYTLPLGSHELFVEDTYYQNDPVLDRSALSRRIDEYCNDQGFDGEILGGETGVLPVITGGNFSRHQRETRIEGVAMAGARGGFVHPLTSYTLPFAAQTALEIARNADLPGPMLAAMLEARAAKHWRSTKFYRKLGRMLLGATKPNQRYKVFEHFYRSDDDLVERFYAAKSTASDKIRILSGKPPVPIIGAMRALITSGKPLISGTIT